MVKLVPCQGNCKENSHIYGSAKHKACQMVAATLVNPKSREKSNLSAICTPFSVKENKPVRELIEFIEDLAEDNEMTPKEMAETVLVNAPENGYSEEAIQEAREHFRKIAPSDLLDDSAPLSDDELFDLAQVTGFHRTGTEGIYFLSMENRNFEATGDLKTLAKEASRRTGNKDILKVEDKHIGAF